MMLTTLYEVLNDKNLNDNTKKELVKSFDKVLSLDLLTEKSFEIDKEKLEYINQKIKERNEAKKNKDYTLADKIRDDLLKENIKLKDTREGTTFELI